ncbi:response regulator transcription factor [Paractinoplanes maris]|uniref:response regulator transcription factor n=1 Tax=Paractinoplanes maris TaxID=1734446 RepID=UPI0027E11ED0|nr:LuxR C-terminal-related transcriptional regulator [Actinoplanes maris]
MIRAAVIAERAIVRKGIAAALSSAAVTVIGEAEDLRLGHDSLLAHTPDVVVIDTAVLAGRPWAAAAGNPSTSVESRAARIDARWRDPIERMALLSSREREVLNLIGDGLSNHAIAGRLNLADRTVKTHVGRILAKLDVDSRLQAGLVTMASRVA